MASSIIPLAGASPSVQLGSTYGVYLISVIVAAVLYGFTVLQALYYYEQFPKDKLVLKVTVGVLWALDTLTIFLDSHGAYFYLISNFTNITALDQEVWSVQAELLVTYTVVLIVQIFFILRMHHLRPHLWYIPVFFGLLAVASYASLIVIFTRVQQNTTWSKTASPDVIVRMLDSLRLYRATKSIGINSALPAANWVMGNVVDIGITVVLCWYLWSEKVGVPHRTNVMLNRIIVFLINRGAIAAWVQVLTLLTKLIFPRTFVWLAFHTILSKVYTNSMLATLNARVGFREIIRDHQLDQTKPPSEFSTSGRTSRLTIEFVDAPVYPPAALDHTSRRSAYATHGSHSTTTGSGSSAYDQQSGRRGSFHQRAVASDQNSVATDLTDYPPHVNHVASASPRYTRTMIRTPESIDIHVI
ncbi:hypothetical protein LXA43DRAFT_1100121 [Ganoderma leucocontextum]|nr:hypothetical protein LXA43DRAFT_1100121 [Ganoderma leucocontextum]